MTAQDTTDNMKITWAPGARFSSAQSRRGCTQSALCVWPFENTKKNISINHRTIKNKYDKTTAKTVLVAVSRVVYNRPRPNDNVAKACYVLKIHSSHQGCLQT